MAASPSCMSLASLLSALVFSRPSVSSRHVGIRLDDDDDDEEASNADGAVVDGVCTYIFSWSWSIDSSFSSVAGT
jgi:hypothetical protein